MSAVLWTLVGGLAGLLVGTVLAVAAALAWASALPNPNDGTYAMRQMVVCLPVGALIGLAAGVLWGIAR